MRTLRNNGERWYVDSRSLWKRVRTWFIWVGGWERANGAGWEFSIPPSGPHSPRIWLNPTPLSLLGHRFTLYKTGPQWWFQLRLSSGWLVVLLRDRVAYISRDGTPNSAHHWLWGLHRSPDARDAMRQAVEAKRRDAVQERIYAERLAAARTPTEEGGQ